MNIQEVADKFLGHKATDKITGFTGTAVGVVGYLTGCTQVGLQPGVCKDGKVQDSQYFDHTRLDVVSESRLIVDTPTAADVGGPNRDCPR